jgi:predicted dehydrogenase
VKTIPCQQEFLDSSSDVAVGIFMKKKVNLGIIGLGAQGKLSLHNALHLDDADVLGVADVSQRALSYAREVGVTNVYRNFDALLRNEEIDAVVINLPTYLHLEGAEKAAERGKHILLEKPLARNVEEGERILSAVRKNHVKLMMGYDMRFNPVFTRIHNDILDGLFGSVMISEATNVSGGPFTPRSDKVGPVQVPSWWLERELAGGGVLLDLGSHMINLLAWYFGEVEYATGIFEHRFRIDLEDSATCLLKFKDGPVATVKVGWFSKGFCQSIQICGTAKNETVVVHPQSTFQKALQGFERKVGLGSSSHYLKIKHFVESIQRDELPKPSGEEGLYDLKVISMAYGNALHSK